MSKATERRAYQERFLSYFERMVQAHEAMSQEQCADLDRWEAENLGDASDGRLGTSDWPGWEPLIGLPPWREKAQA